MVFKKQCIKKGTQNRKYKDLKCIKCWSNGRVIKRAKVDWDHKGIWEELRAYKQVDGSMKIFRLEDHVDRLYRSARMCMITVPRDRNSIIKGCRSVVEANLKEDLDLKIIIEGKDIHILVRLANKAVKSCSTIISTVPRGYPRYMGQCFSSQSQITVNHTTPFDEALVVDSNMHVYSGTSANLFIIMGDVIITPPNDGSSLQGITKRTVVELLQTAGLMFSKYKKVPIIIEKPITIPDVYISDGVLLTSTYGEIQAVHEVNNLAVKSEDNFYFKMLCEEYSNLVRGRNEIKSRVSSR